MKFNREKIILSLFIFGYILFCISMLLPSISGPQLYVFGRWMDRSCFVGYEAIVLSFVLPYIVATKGDILIFHGIYLVTVPICNLLTIISPLLFYVKLNRYILFIILCFVFYFLILPWCILFMRPLFRQICIGYYVWSFSIDLIMVSILISKTKIMSRITM